MYNFFGNEDFMKKMYEQWEKMMTDQMEKMVHDENFVSELAKTMAATMTGKFMSTKFMDESLTAMNLPTRGEIVKTLQKLTDVEERLIDLSEKMEDQMRETNATLELIKQRLDIRGEATDKSQDKTNKKSNKQK